MEAVTVIASVVIAPSPDREYVILLDDREAAMVEVLNDKLTDTLAVAAVTPIESVITQPHVAEELDGAVPDADQVTVVLVDELTDKVLPAEDDQA